MTDRHRLGIRDVYAMEVADDLTSSDDLLVHYIADAELTGDVEVVDVLDFRHGAGDAEMLGVHRRDHIDLRAAGQREEGLCVADPLRDQQIGVGGITMDDEGIVVGHFGELPALLQIPLNDFHAHIVRKELRSA